MNWCLILMTWTLNFFRFTEEIIWTEKKGSVREFMDTTGMIALPVRGVNSGLNPI